MLTFSNGISSNSKDRRERRQGREEGRPSPRGRWKLLGPRPSTRSCCSASDCGPLGACSQGACARGSAPALRCSITGRRSSLGLGWGPGSFRLPVLGLAFTRFLLRLFTLAQFPHPAMRQGCRGCTLQEASPWKALEGLWPQVPLPSHSPSLSPGVPRSPDPRDRLHGTDTTELGQAQESRKWAEEPGGPVRGNSRVLRPQLPLLCI